MVSQWQPFVDQAVAQLVAASVPALADTAVSDVITLGGSEPDINRLAQAAENLNVAVHPRVTAPSSGKDWSSTEEWRADREDDSKNVKQVLAILQERVCDGNSQAVSVTSRDIFNGAQYPAQFSAKRIKLSPTKTDCLIVAKSAADQKHLPSGLWSVVSKMFCSNPCFSFHTCNGHAAGFHCLPFHTIIWQLIAEDALFAHLWVLCCLLLYSGAAFWNG